MENQKNATDQVTFGGIEALQLNRDVHGVPSAYHRHGDGFARSVFRERIGKTLNATDSVWSDCRHYIARSQFPICPLAYND